MTDSGFQLLPARGLLDGEDVILVQSSPYAGPSMHLDGDFSSSADLCAESWSTLFSSVTASRYLWTAVSGTGVHDTVRENLPALTLTGGSRSWLGIAAAMRLQTVRWLPQAGTSYECGS